MIMTSQHSNGSIDIKFESKIAFLEFGHPLSNSLPGSLLHQLANEFDDLSQNKAISVIIIKSIGTSAFCAGASFDELLAISNQEQATQFFSGFAKVINAMRNCSKIIIGRIQGKAVGGGVGIVSACDYAMATFESAIKLSELAIGIGPFVIEPALSRKIGRTAMFEMTLETQWKSATWACKKGLYSKIFETVSEMDSEILTFANTLANYNPESLFEMKKVFWEGTENWGNLLFERAAISGKLVLSDYSKKALNDFKQKK